MPSLHADKVSINNNQLQKDLDQIRGDATVVAMEASEEKTQLKRNLRTPSSTTPTESPGESKHTTTQINKHPIKIDAFSHSDVISTRRCAVRHPPRDLWETEKLHTRFVLTLTGRNMLLAALENSLVAFVFEPRDKKATVDSIPLPLSAAPAIPGNPSLVIEKAAS